MNNPETIHLLNLVLRLCIGVLVIWICALVVLLVVNGVWSFRQWRARMKTNVTNETSRKEHP